MGMLEEKGIGKEGDWDFNCTPVDTPWKRDA